ncbi:MAG: amidohydrolase [Desulfovibrio sp.]|uniref:amidohydrolase family protein n=1 Tax=Desulfovibrio sp. TaxID=885 RepID=UPI00135E208F|nr:amidohydrolase [Desulfovibrio sp.]MTJ91888.1 amidohydrolase [Desulfovibrio sp.]
MRHCDTLLHAAFIVTQDEQRRVIENASLAIDKGLIADIGPTAELIQRWQASETLHLEDKLVLPGLINAHTHAAMTFLRGLADDMPLMDWLNQRIFPVEQKLTPELVRLGSLMGYAEMLRTGTTACVDMYLFEAAVFEAADTAGLRCLGGEAVFAFPSAAFPGPQAALDATRALAEKYRNHDRLRVAVNPHSVYTTTPEILTACRDLAQEQSLPLHIHLAETPSETQICLSAQGKRPTEYCHSLGLLDVPCTLAHVVDVTSAELDLLARQKAVVAHNPSSNMKLASGAAPVAAMLARGMNVGLGTDGAASNNRLNMFTEMGRSALLHKLTGLDPTLLPAGQVLDMATLGGAAAMHDARLGSLAPGMAADCIALDLTEPNLQPMYNEVSHIVYAATGMETRMTMVGGEVLYNEGRFTRFDYAALREEMRDVRRFVLEASGS